MIATTGVDLTTNQSINGIKTFLTSPVIPNAVNNNQPISLGQANSAYAALAGSSSQTFNVANATLNQHAVTLSQVTSLIAANPIGIGYGQTWQDVSTNRTINTNYVNSTTKPIMVAVSIPGYNSWVLTIVVGGINAAAIGNDQYSGTRIATVIVPVGSTYRVTGSGFSKWTELR